MKIIGIDEVGRGAIAGPIVAASFSINTKILKKLYQSLHYIKENDKSFYRSTTVKQLDRLLKLVSFDLNIIDKESPFQRLSSFESKLIENILHIQDSKKMTGIQRKKVAEILLNLGKWGIGVVSNRLIDEKGISWANNEVFLKALKTHSKTVNNVVLTDHFTIREDAKRESPNSYYANPLRESFEDQEASKDKSGDSSRSAGLKQITSFQYIPVTKGDSKSFVIACASIIAKEYRDYLMQQMHKTFPQYNFAKHVGYGTKEHLEAIKKHGLCEIHRRSYKLRVKVI